MTSSRKSSVAFSFRSDDFEDFYFVVRLRLRYSHIVNTKERDLLYVNVIKYCPRGRKTVA